MPSAPNNDDALDEGNDLGIQDFHDQDEDSDYQNVGSDQESDTSLYEDDHSDDPATSDSDDQIDETTNVRLVEYTISPSSPRKAKVQGIALLRALFVDPDGEIARNIIKVKGFNVQHASNEKCKKVQKYLTGVSDVADDTVPFVIAIWCMLGGNIPTMWTELGEGSKAGVKRPLTDWGRQMVRELRHLGTGDNFNFQLCSPYTTGEAAMRFYNYAEAVKGFKEFPSVSAKTSTVRKAKHVGSLSSGNPRSAKRRKVTRMRGQLEQQTSSSAANEAQHEDLDHQLNDAPVNPAHDGGQFAEPSREVLMDEINGLSLQNLNQAKTITYLSNAMEALREEKVAMEEEALVLEVNRLKVQITDQFTTIRNLGNSLEAAQQEKMATEEKGVQARKVANDYILELLETNKKLEAQLEESRRQTGSASNPRPH